MEEAKNAYEDGADYLGVGCYFFNKKQKNDAQDVSMKTLNENLPKS